MKILVVGSGGREHAIIKKIKEKFSTIVSVNGESTITTDEYGAFLLEETERRGIIRIREKSITDMRSTKP